MHREQAWLLQERQGQGSFDEQTQGTAGVPAAPASGGEEAESGGKQNAEGDHAELRPASSLGQRGPLEEQRRRYFVPVLRVLEAAYQQADH